jgi:uncharacterized membrane protein
MMNSHLHPMAVHMPLAISILMPAFLAASLYYSRPQHFGPRAFLLVIGTAAIIFISGALAYWTGEQDAFFSAAGADAIEAHRLAAKLFMLAAALFFFTACLFYFRLLKRGLLSIVFLSALSLIILALSIWTGHLGGLLLE